MPNKARRPSYRNRLSVATLTSATLLCVVLASAFVAFVVSRNRLSALADEQRRVEQQIALFHQEIQALEKRIDTSLTRDKVHERLTAGNTFLKPIEPGSIITLTKLQAPVVTETETVSPTVAQTTLQ
jgi:septal ring factor EnvC (AmiA/AmiB activator)